MFTACLAAPKWPKINESNFKVSNKNKLVWVSIVPLVMKTEWNIFTALAYLLYIYIYTVNAVRWHPLIIFALLNWLNATSSFHFYIIVKKDRTGVGSGPHTVHLVRNNMHDIRQAAVHFKHARWHMKHNMELLQSWANHTYSWANDN